MGKYFLSLNNEKSKYTPFPYYIIENLEKIYANYTTASVTEADLMALFNSFFDLEKRGTKGAIRFLIKSIDSRFTSPNNDLLLSYLINVLVNDSRSLVKVCELIIRQMPRITFDSKAIVLVENLLEQQIAANNHLETIWLLYLRKKISTTRLPAKISNRIIESNNDLAKIILIEEFKSNLSAKALQRIVDGASSWLLCYQLFFHNYMDRDAFSTKSHITRNVAFYAQLKRNSFSFYHKNNTVS